MLKRLLLVVHWSSFVVGVVWILAFYLADESDPPLAMFYANAALVTGGYVLVCIFIYIIQGRWIWFPWQQK